MVTEVETETVSFSVIGVERVHGRGELVAIAVVELSIAGVTVTLYGLQVRRIGSNRVTVALPAFKHPRDGVMKTAIGLPPEMWEPIGAAVANAYDTLGHPTSLTGEVRGETWLSTR